MTSFGFGQPWWLLLLPVLGWWFWRLGEKGTSGAILHSSTSLVAKLGRQRMGSPGKILRAIRFLAMLFIVVSLARPRMAQGEIPDPNKGIDIMLVCDASGSMTEEDFAVGAKKISRREALLQAISTFVDARVKDRIGMIGFGKNTYLLSPLTTDGEWIKEVYRLTAPRMDGTAIGDAIAAGVNKLQENPARSKVMILVTDGENNAGSNPLDAAEYARGKNVRIYALEIINPLYIRAAAAAKSPLAQIATRTGGQYFQAADTGALIQIYRQIDQMEKHEFDATHHMLYRELFVWFVVMGAMLILFEGLAGNSFWMRVP